MPNRDLDRARRIFIPDVVGGPASDLTRTLLTRRTPTDPEIFGIIAAAQALPEPLRFPELPTPRRGPAQVIPFPSTGPTPTALRRLLRIGGGVIGATLTLEDILRQIEDQRSLEQGREIEARIEGLRERLRIRRQLDAGLVGDTPIRTIPQGEPDPTAPELPIEIPRPELQPLPVFAPETPGTPVVRPDALPEIDIPAPALPAPRPSKTPGAPQKRPKSPAPPTPAPLPGPGSTPGTGPGRRGIPRRAPRRRRAFFPVLNPIGSPSTFSAGQPATNPTNLTRFRRTVQESLGQQLGQIISAQPQPQPETNPDRCQEVKRRRRRKGRCKEGFFREFPGKTQFIEWREVDCATRSDISEFGGFLDAAEGDNVIQFPGA